MFNLSLLNIATASFVPCAAVGTSVYIGYKQYYKSSTVTTTPTPTTDFKSSETTTNELSSDLNNKLKQLDNLKALLKTQESFLATEELNRVKLENDILHFEIAITDIDKKNIEAKLADFINKWDAKDAHTKSIASVTEQKGVAEGDKKTKQGLVDTKNVEINEADTLHKAQLAKEETARKTTEKSDDDVTKATNAYTAQLEVEKPKKATYTQNDEKIKSNTDLIAAETSAKATLDESKKSTKLAETNGKTVCDAALTTATITTDCDNTTVEDGQTDEVKNALNAYALLKQAYKTAEEAVTAIEKKIGGFQMELDKANQAKTTLKEDCDKEKAKSESLLSAKNAAIQKQATDQKAYEAEQKTSKELEQAHEKLKTELIQLQGDLTTATNTFNGLVEQLDNLKGQTNNIESQLKEAKTVFVTLVVSSINSKEEANVAAQLKIQQLEKIITTKTAALTDKTPIEGLNGKATEEITSLITETKEQLKKVKEKITAIGQQITSLQTNITSISSEIELPAKVEASAK